MDVLVECCLKFPTPSGNIRLPAEISDPSDGNLWCGQKSPTQGGYFQLGRWKTPIGKPRLTGRLAGGDSDHGLGWVSFLKVPESMGSAFG
jgi:hypothetical protein